MRDLGGRFSRACRLVVALALVAQAIPIAPAIAVAQTPSSPQRIELAGKRTTYTRTYVRDDGTFESEAFLRPINYRSK